MFTLILLGINIFTLALGLIRIGEKKPDDKDDDDDDDYRRDYPCA